jgi:Fe2+ or Zn2+ uptake regulation protein
VPPKREVEVLEKRILDHLVENPRAGDTVEGITRWWLLQQNIVQAIAQVQAALDHLVKQNAVTKHQGPDGRTYYRARSWVAQQ